MKVGDLIFYTGDVVNENGWFEIKAVELKGLYMKLMEVDGTRIMSIPFCHIYTNYDGTCRHRFVTEKAYKEFKK